MESIRPVKCEEQYLTIFVRLCVVKFYPGLRTMHRRSHVQIGTCINRVGQICFLEIAVTNTSSQDVGTLTAFQNWAGKPFVVAGIRIFEVVVEAVSLLLDVINPNRPNISQYWPRKPCTCTLTPLVTSRWFQNISVLFRFSTMSFACFGDVLAVVSFHCGVSEFNLNCVSVYLA